MSGCLPADLQSLAIALPSWIGDTVMATPVLRAARIAFPESKLVGIVRPGLDEILNGSPWLDSLTVCQMKGVLGPMRLAKAIRSHHAEAALLLPNSFRSALGARLSGLSLRVGYERDARGWLLTHSLKTQHDKQPTSAIDYYAALGEFALGSNIDDRNLELTVTDDEQAEGNRLLEDVPRPFVLLNPGANRKDKRWPTKRFAILADTLRDSLNLTPVLTGSPAEREVLDAVQQAATTPLIDISKRNVRLGTLKAVIREAALLITNDTGPRHIAIALNTPVVSLFGPTDYRWTVVPNANEHVVLANPFLPEDLIADDNHEQCAIDRITVRDVYSAAERMLNCNEPAERF